MEWFDFSGLGPHLARLRRWFDKLPERKFSDLSPAQKLGRLGLVLAVVALLVGPFVWMLAS